MKVLCPYNLKTQKTVTQTTHQISEAPDATDTQEIHVITNTMQTCAREVCGAWVDGHCDYHGAAE